MIASILGDSGLENQLIILILAIYIPNIILTVLLNPATFFLFQSKCNYINFKK